MKLPLCRVFMQHGGLLFAGAARPVLPTFSFVPIAFFIIMWYNYLGKVYPSANLQRK